MKRLIVATGLLASLLVVGAGTGEAAVTTNTTTPSAFTFFDPCTGESVAVSGDVHLVVTSTVNGSTISGTTHTQFKATGVGLDSGLRYQEQVEFNSVFETSLQNGAATSTTEGLIKVVAPGGGNNQSSPIFFHMTFDANGNLTSVRVEPPTVTCQ